MSENHWLNSLTNSYKPDSDLQRWRTLESYAVPLLVKVVKTTGGITGKAAYRTFRDGLPAHVRRLVPAPVDHSWRRAHALNILGDLAADRSIPVVPILEALRDDDQEVRMSAAACVIELVKSENLDDQEERVARALVQAYKDGLDAQAAGGANENLRNNVVVAMGYFQSQASIVATALEEARNDPNEGVRVRATYALENLRAKAADQRGLD